MNSNHLPFGPALPPGKSMTYKSKFLALSKLRIINENESAAIISVNGIGKYIPGSLDDSKGVLDLSALNFGKELDIKNQCEWVLLIEA
jgi:hypothetical protein